MAFISDQNLVKHFEIRHKMGVSCAFMCGYDGCSVRFKRLKQYQFHFQQVHASNTPGANYPDRGASLESGNGPSELYSCSEPTCAYTCSNANTLRSHRFWHHSTQSNVGNPLPEPAVDGRSSPTASGYCEVANSIFNDEAVVNISHTLKVPTVEEDKAALVQKFLHMYLTLNSVMHIPDRTLQFIVESYRILLKETNSLVLKIIDDRLSKHKLLSHALVHDIVQGALAHSIASSTHGPKGPLRSSFIRKKNFKASFSFVPPKPHLLGTDNFKVMRYYHTVPLSDNLKSFLSEDSVHVQYVENQTRTESNQYYRDILDGSIVSSVMDEPDPSTVLLLVYSDDIELFNPLGSAKTVHKVTNIYVAVGNLHPWSRLKGQCLLLALTCREADIGYFGLEKVLGPLISELESLEEGGI